MVDVKQVEIGDYAYLWIDGKNKGKKKCVITAHGSSLIFNGTKPMKELSYNTKLHYFCRHGFSTTEGINISKNTAPVEVLGSKESPDYELSPDYVLTKFTNGFNVRHRWSEHQGKGEHRRETYASVRYTAGFEDYDVITIRSRWAPSKLIRSKISGVTLFRLLSDLADAGYIYEDVYCSFCRGSVSQASGG